MKLSTLYNSLDPTSISQLLAFYELYPNTPQGNQALAKVWQLLHKHHLSHHSSPSSFSLPSLDINAIISVLTQGMYNSSATLTQEHLEIIDQLSSHLGNRKLKGYKITQKEMILGLETQEIDLARALLLYQFDRVSNPLLEIRKYEATLDLMALQVLARLPANASDLEKIDAINQLIFYEMQFRFPPHSLWSKDIDVYTFLPSVLDNRQGVCLGVSILYLSLAQRLALPLEIVTPPGHIYVRYHSPSLLLNIETTARGIHIPTDHYLGINTYTLQERSIKETIGLAFENQAAMFSEKKDYTTAIELYKKAALFLPDDPFNKMFLGIQYILTGENKQGKQLFKSISGMTFPGAIYHETIPEDYLANRISQEALEAVFMHVDETRDSILKKQKALIKSLKKSPHFRFGLLQLAVSWLQLGRAKEALEVLEKYHHLDPDDPTVNYYLSILSMQRLQYVNSWKFLLHTQEILDRKNHHPKSLKSLEYQLRHLYPEIMHKDCNLI